MGAIASGGIRVLNEDVIRALRLDEEAIGTVAAREWRTLHEREVCYRGERVRPNVTGCVVILVDDGGAAPRSLRAAVQALNEQHPRRLVVAMPVVPPATAEAIRAEVDELVCAVSPPTFYGIGQWYQNFLQTSDEEVRDLLARPMHPAPGRKATPAHCEARPESRPLTSLFTNPPAYLTAQDSDRSATSTRSTHCSLLRRSRPVQKSLDCPHGMNVSANQYLRLLAISRANRHHRKHSRIVLRSRFPI